MKNEKSLMLLITFNRNYIKILIRNVSGRIEVSKPLKNDSYPYLLFQESRLHTISCIFRFIIRDSLPA